MSAARRNLARVVLLAVVAGLLVVPTLSAGAQAVDLSGTWNWTAHAPTGDFAGTATINHNVSAGTFTWSWISGWTGTGTVSGTSWTLHGTTSGYTFDQTGTIVNANTLQGQWSQSDGQTGTTDATRLSGPPTASSSPTPTPTGNADLCIKVAAKSADEILEQYDSCSGELSGDLRMIWYEAFSLRVTVTNNGPDPATNVVAKALTSTGVRLLTENDCIGSRGTACRFNTVPPNASYTSDPIVFRHKGVTEEMPAEVSFTVSSSTGDSNMNNNEASVTPTLLPGGADLSVRAVGPGRSRSGSTATYHVTLRNHGPEKAITIFLSGDFSYGKEGLGTVVSVKGDPRCERVRDSGFSCHVPGLRSNKEVSVELKVVMPERRRGKEVLLDVRASTDPDRDPVGKNDEDRVSTNVVD